MNWMYGFLTIILLIAAIIDFKIKLIPNIFPVLVLLLFLTLLFMGELTLSLNHFYYPIGFFVLGLLLFKFDIMGAGDSKLVTSLLLVLTPVNQEMFLLSLSLVTILMGSFLISFRIISQYKLHLSFLIERNFKGLIMTIKGSKFSFAPTILLAWIFFIWKSYVR